MRLAIINTLKGTEVLARDIYGPEGQLLLKKNSILTESYIKKLMEQNIFFVYVQQPELDDLVIDSKLHLIKNSTLNTLPVLFKNLINTDIKSVKNSLNTIEELVDYIIYKKDINTNLYELKLYDNYTYIHCLDTCIMATYLGVCMKLSKSSIKKLGIAAALHDIGKMHIPNSIINKKSRLTESEFLMIKNHPTYGKEILKSTPTINPTILQAVEQHHEKYDGSGYPYGLKGNTIDKLARIISVCDVFTAVSSNRSYRNRFDPYEAYELILSSSETHFDPEIVRCFRYNFYVYPRGACLKLSNGIEGFVIRQNKGYPDRPIIRVIYDKYKNKIPPYELDLINHVNITVKEII